METNQNHKQDAHQLSTPEDVWSVYSLACAEEETSIVVAKSVADKYRDEGENRSDLDILAYLANKFS